MASLLNSRKKLWNVGFTTLNSSIPDGSGFPRQLHSSAHDSRRLLTFHLIYQFAITHLVNGVKVRRNQPQGSKSGLKVRTRQNLRGSSPSRSGRCQGTNGNLECILCLKKDMSSTNESAR